ncbi:MAG: DUF4869 domain-containing protein [Erysipelotrichaceae bacterium]|nr:DUF4869 domain-containing protein [Erysipelotrichaceae bacterium]MCD7892281.1 DUF4869 domain-containing protein [Erysipelotrichaceae bacterium]
MLKVLFGFDKDCIRDIDLYFDNVYEDEWLEDELIKKMILDVDQSVVKGKQLIISPVLGPIPPERLSGGVKALICMYKSDAYIDLIVCGPNCEKWILEIAQNKDIIVGMSGYDLTFKNMNIEAICLNDQSNITNYVDWILKMNEYVGD